MTQKKLYPYWTVTTATYGSSFVVMKVTSRGVSGKLHGSIDGSPASRRDWGVNGAFSTEELAREALQKHKTRWGEFEQQVSAARAQHRAALDALDAAYDARGKAAKEAAEALSDVTLEPSATSSFVL